MNTNDPKNKAAEDVANDYDADSKVINQENPVREGTEESSIRADEGAADKNYSKLKENDNQLRGQQEFIDDDENNIKPEN